MTFTMSGGGSHWWEYVITKSGVFTNSQSGHYPIKGMLVSSPNGDYLCEKDKDYELKEREVDMYEYYEEEIMNYTDSSEEEDSEEEDSNVP